MKRPYCVIGVNKYQLYEINGVIRFNDIGIFEQDYNKLWIDYQNNKISLSCVLLFYTNYGCSYELVYQLFSKCGINNHCVLNGKEKPFKFQYYPKLNKK